MRGLAGLALCVVVPAVVAQERPIEERLAALQYPKLARVARVQGDVHVVIEAGVPRVVSGNQMLGGSFATENAKTLLPTADSADLVLHYVVVPGDNEQVQRTEPKGNAFGRFFLRVFHLPEYRVVAVWICAEDKGLPANRAEFTTNPIEVWIYGGARCLQPETAYYARSNFS